MTGSVWFGTRFVIIAAIVAVALGCFPLFCAAEEDIDGVKKVTGRTGYAGLLSKAASVGSTRVIVQVSDDFTVEPVLDKAAVAAQRAASLKAQNRLIAELSAKGVKPTSFYHYKYIPYTAMTVSEAGLKVLVGSDRALSIQEDAISHPGAVPTPGWNIPVIGASTMHGAGITGSGMTIAVVDTGVDKTHPYLTGAVISEACYSTNSTAAKQSSLCPGGVSSSIAAGSAMPYGGKCPVPAVAGEGECDHGTHVAGIVAGRNGVAGSPGPGVAPQASVIAIQVFTYSEDTKECPSGIIPCVTANDSDIIKALERVYELHQQGGLTIVSVNMSLGGGQYTENCDDQKAFKNIVDTLRAANIATVASTGNSGYCGAMGSPACVSSVVSVGATDVNDLVAAYSNSASFMSLLAPGSAITSSVPVVGGTAYASWNGTSMAAPHVAGVWALMRQASPSATVSDVLSALASTGASVTDSGCSAITKKRINVNEASTRLQSGAVLTVTIGGNGKGAVTANGLTCTNSVSCSGTYVTGTIVTITAQASSGNAFDGWTGCATATGNVCTVVVDSAKTVTASFGLPPVMAVIPGSLNFGTVKKGVLSERQVTVKNNGPKGSAHLTVSGADITAPSDFAVTATTCAAPLARGESCTVTVGLTSTAYGSESGLLRVTTNDTKRSPVGVRLAGNAAPPAISASSNVNFGTVTVGQTSAVRQVTVRNTGFSDLTFTFIGLDGKGGPFAVASDGCTGQVLGRGQTCTIGLTFRPSAAVTASGHLIIQSNDPNASRATLTRVLSGRGKI